MYMSVNNCTPGRAAALILCIFIIWLCNQTAPWSPGQCQISTPLLTDTSSDSHDTETKQSSDNQSDASHHNKGPLHPGVTCDGCKGPICGIRFKCLLCPNYDLCSACEGTGGHLEHNMVAMDTPQESHPCWFGSGYRRGPFPFGQPHPLPPWLGAGWAGGRGRGCPWRKRCHRGGCGEGKESHSCPSKSDPPTDGVGGAPTQPGEQKVGADKGAQPTITERGNGECEWSPDQQRGFLHNIGEAVTSFLEPFGVKVDVDVVVKKSSPEGTGDSGVPPGGGGATNTQAAEVRRCSSLSGNKSWRA